MIVEIGMINNNFMYETRIPNIGRLRIIYSKNKNKT